jgi:hypothetical protein
VALVAGAIAYLSRKDIMSKSLWEKQAPSRIQKPEKKAPAKKAPAKKAPAKKK